MTGWRQILSWEVETSAPIGWLCETRFGTYTVVVAISKGPQDEEVCWGWQSTGVETEALADFEALTSENAKPITRGGELRWNDKEDLEPLYYVDSPPDFVDVSEL